MSSDPRAAPRSHPTVPPRHTVRNTLALSFALGGLLFAWQHLAAPTDASGAPAGDSGGAPVAAAGPGQVATPATRFLEREQVAFDGPFAGALDDPQPRAAGARFPGPKAGSVAGGSAGTSAGTGGGVSPLGGGAGGGGGSAERASGTGGRPGDGTDTDSAGALSVPVLVQEALAPGEAGIDRSGVVATFGMPFAQGVVPVVFDRPALGVHGSDDWQFRTLQTWPDGSVRWAQVDVATDVQAGQIESGLTITPGLGRSPGDNLVRKAFAGAAWLIDTGPLQAIVLRDHFNLLAAVAVDGQLIAGPSYGLGLYGTAVDGGLLRPGVDTLVSLEENGPARCVIRADGPLVDANGVSVIDFTCRIAARAGAREVEVTLTVRNANPLRPVHAQVGSIEMLVRGAPGAQPVASVPMPDRSVLSRPLSQSGHLYAYQAQSSAPTLGPGSSLWLPHIPKQPGSQSELVDQGYRVEEPGQVWHDLGSKGDWPAHGWLDLSGSHGGITVAIENMPYLWPASVEASGGGLVVAGVFTARNAAPYTFVYGQHESRRAVFAFHAGPAVEPADAVARRLDRPLSGRAADYAYYEQTHVFPYHLLTVEQQQKAYEILGIDHTVEAKHPTAEITRYLYKGTTGGWNNAPTVLTQLACEWLRYGFGGSLRRGLDLSLWKSEWQVLRSDGVHVDAMPPVQNWNLPHTDGHVGDDEHRYRAGMVLAYLLTGDERIREALYDEAEVLAGVSLWPHERSMYQTLRALAAVGEFTGDPVLIQRLRDRLAYITSPLLDVDVAQRGYGWESLPGQGDRRYFVYDGENQSEKPPGEHFQARGFISASFGPIAYFLAAERLAMLDPSDPLVAATRGRLTDLAAWTRAELFPWKPDPAERQIAYSYAVSLQQVTQWEDWDFHPILLGMGAAWRLTGDQVFLKRGVEQVEAHAAHDNGPFQSNLYLLDSRLDCQDFFAACLEWAGADVADRRGSSDQAAAGHREH